MNLTNRKLKKLTLTLAALCGFFIAGIGGAWATCSNYTTYTSGQTLTASSLNSLQTNYTNCVNAVLDGDTFTGNILFHSGSDVIFYSDTGSTKTAEILGDTGGAIMGLRMQGRLINICFAQGADTSQVKITSCNGSAFSATNPGFVDLRSSTAGTNTLFKVSADVTIDLSSIDFGTDTKGDVTSMILRSYAINDNGTLRWGFGYQGGFTYIRNTQDSTTATGANLPEEIYTNGDVTTDNSPVSNVGYVVGSRNDTTNEWATTEYHPNESADGVWQNFVTTYTGFSVAPSGGYLKWTSIGTTAMFDLNPDTAGTSNATTFTIQAPTKAKYVSVGCGSAGLSFNNSGVILYAPRLDTDTASATISVFADGGGSAWTGANGKNVRSRCSYEMYQP